MVEHLRLEVLRVQCGAEVGRCWQVSIQEVVVCMKVFLSWQTGALPAGGTVVTPEEQ